ncbi:sporulation protein YunB [Heyndrickxia oleronia]|uniref:sporulation protein YunB n=1 Tax=Heyndrickxia oleronia TaxID=38875 RepID=UPI001B101B43|nr:sporulation protein YunB [Heyndrickxia oleronia]GIN42039.1 sporulation protein YunB [Heyndrickxia oleronia]
MGKFRPRKSRRGPLPFRYVVLLTFAFFIFSTIGGLVIVNKGLKPTIVRYAESQNQKIAANAISYAVKEIVKNIELNDMVKFVPNEKGNVAVVEGNPTMLNKMTADVQQLVQNYLNGAEEGKLQEVQEGKYNKSTGELVYSVPLGRVTNNVLLGNLGPDIPTKFHVIGDVKVDPKIVMEEEGINSTHIKTYIQVTVNVQTIIPFASKVAVYHQTIPGPFGSYKGDIPLYNSNGESSSPSIQLDEKKDKNK